MHQVTQVPTHPSRQNSAGGDVVAVAESTGQTEDLVAARQSRVFHQSPDVDAFGDRTGQLKGMSGFDIAVGTGSTQDENARLRHGNAVWQTSGGTEFNPQSLVFSALIGNDRRAAIAKNRTGNQDACSLL
jgi:hypothetical protein